MQFETNAPSLSVLATSDHQPKAIAYPHSIRSALKVRLPTRSEETRRVRVVHREYDSLRRLVRCSTAYEETQLVLLRAV